MIYQPIENTGKYTTGTVYSEGYVKSLEQEVKRLQNELDKTICKNIDLHSIIKEVREYILQHCEIIRDEEKNVDMVGRIEGIPLLEILDKENKDVKN